MAHSAAPTQKLKGNEWRVVGTLIPYLLEYKGRVALALACLIVAKLANVGVPLVMKEVVQIVVFSSYITRAAPGYHGATVIHPPNDQPSMKG